MTSVSTQQKSLHQLLSKFITSGINISPAALELLQYLPISWKDIDTLIQKISFSPNFSSHISIDSLRDEFGKDLILKSKLEEKGFTKEEKREFLSDLEQKGYLKPDNACDVETFEESHPTKTKSHTSNDNNSKTSSTKRQENASTKITDDILAQEQEFDMEAIVFEDDSLLSSSSKKKEFISMKQIDNPKPKIATEPQLTSKRKSGDQELSIAENISRKESFESNNLETNEIDEIAQIRAKKRQKWEKIQKISIGTSTFTPIASEYDAEFEILKDPTGHLFTSGKMDEFIDLIRDRYEKLKSILKKRPDGHDLLDINMINRLESSVEVKFVGMVVEKRQTSNKNYIIKMEDPTGMCTLLVRPEPVELYNLVNYLLPDHVVIIDGYLSVNQEKNSRIILVNNIIFPDSPNQRRIQCPEEDLAICLISDTHFGSKDWLGKVWDRFVDYLNCKIGSEKQRIQAGKIKYLSIAGDIVDGIGVFPNQERRLTITDIYKQYEDAADHFKDIPDYIEIILSPGDHDAVRKAIPTPALDKDIAGSLYSDSRIHLVGCPSLVSMHGIKTQVFHGTSLIDMNMSIPGMTNEDPVKTMREFIHARHLAPTYGKKTEIAPVEEDWLVLETLPDILHAGHLHKNGLGSYHGTLLVNSGCFQGQTQFMDNLGIEPDFGKPTIINIKDKLSPRVIDLISDY